MVLRCPRQAKYLIRHAEGDTILPNDDWVLMAADLGVAGLACHQSGWACHPTAGEEVESSRESLGASLR
jgi:hypothetical protein